MKTPKESSLLENVLIVFILGLMALVISPLFQTQSHNEGTNLHLNERRAIYLAREFEIRNKETDAFNFVASSVEQDDNILRVEFTRDGQGRARLYVNLQTEEVYVPDTFDKLFSSSRIDNSLKPINEKELDQTVTTPDD